MRSILSFPKKFLWLGLVLLGVAALGASASRYETDAPAVATAPALPVAVLQVHAASAYPVSEQHAGRVVARRVSELGFERSGRLTEVIFDQGERVEAGAVVARLDTRELRARRRELSAQRNRIAAELSLAKATTIRRLQLHDAGHLSNQRLDETAYAEASLAAQAEAATAALEQVDVQLALSELRAPFAGILAQRFADEGTVVQPGASILQLLEDRALEVHVGVPASAVSQLTPGSAYPVEVAGLSVDATLAAILPTIDSDTRTVTAVFQLGDVPVQVRPGALARIVFEQQIEADGFWLPMAALAEGRRGLWSAYVAVPEPVGGFVLEKRQVEVIHAEAARVFVSGTLVDGDRVVAAGVHRLVPGANVRPVASEG